VGLIKVCCYRPFPSEAIFEICKSARAVAVLDQGFSMGSEGPLSLDVKAALSNLKTPAVFSFITGLAGREVTIETIQEITSTVRKVIDSGQVVRGSQWVDLNRSIL
jgi:pyruvate ferredoxin oxidoreductase alpha subunit